MLYILFRDKHKAWCRTEMILYTMEIRGRGDARVHGQAVVGATMAYRRGDGCETH
jgi:hypothetical protein